MRRSRLLLRITAVLALGGLASAQSMACCWRLDKAVEPAAMTADHSCCHKAQTDVTGEKVAAPPVVMKNCCGKAISEAQISPSVSIPHFALENASPTFPLAPVIATRFIATNKHFDSGPPRFLSLRLLI